MKKISLILTVIAILALVVVGACGGDNGEQDTSPTTSPTSQATTAPPSTEPSNGGNGGDGGLTWNDVPVYDGADQREEFFMSFSPDEGEYSEFEWRYYECDADVEDIVDFYKDKMPDNGWEEIWWMEAGEIAYGMYMKNNEKDAAVIWIAGEGGNTMLGLWRATE